ncbi:Sodium/hydrogen exchanger family-domain-containing protein [Lactarius akahatsu]|uniref:Sodium/hydrogen exchanger family-domain-containing protein n=1 Tax=Lactarius akahatsu TaxID=416441 RepID=A0AAD4LEY9_9AGAM|nr:Sodium/hydrogen exchanger family-domain-containing protein [Lactarius akahatsu]
MADLRGCDAHDQKWDQISLFQAALTPGGAVDPETTVGNTIEVAKGPPMMVAPLLSPGLRGRFGFFLPSSSVPGGESEWDRNSRKAMPNGLSNSLFKTRPETLVRSKVRSVGVSAESHPSPRHRWAYQVRPTGPTSTLRLVNGDWWGRYHDPECVFLFATPSTPAKMSGFSRQIINIVRTSTFQRRAAPGSGIIIVTTQILSLGLRKLRQPRVIAEVLGGILLGPTAFGRIPGFSKHIFPSESIPYLSLVANIGLCLFLFIIGLEIDTAIIRRNARLLRLSPLAGVIIPFGLGAVLAVPLYKHFIDSSQVSYTHFMLFTGVAYSITAFPVLCRILTELKLLDTTVGIVVLSAGVGNDIIGWTLLALSVALVNAGSGLTALWILLGAILHSLLMSLAFTQFSVCVFSTSAFLAGIIVPRDGGLAIALTEKLEDMVSVIFLPLILLLGTIWGFTAAICILAFIGKFGACALAARYTGFSWREASTIGSLMSCKGLIELIVLNVGLQAGILTRLVFSMFVLEALLLTFATTPTVSFLYPPHLRSRATAAGPSFANVRDPKDDETGTRDRWPSTGHDEDGVWKRRFTVILDKLEHLPSMMAITQLLQPPAPPIYRTDSSSSSQRSGMEEEEPAHFGALRLIELTDRPSDVMKSSATDALLHTDPLLAIFRTFSELNGLSVSAALSMVPFDALATSVGEHVRAAGAQLVLVPWLPSAQAAPESGGVPTSDAADAATTAGRSPFDSLFRTSGSTSLLHSHFVRGVFAQAGTNVALFVGRAPLGNLVVQLCANPRVRATVVRLTKHDVRAELAAPDVAHLAKDKVEVDMQANTMMTIASVRSTPGFPDTMYGNATTHTRMQSETADGVIWARYAPPAAAATNDRALADALSRVTFEELASPTPLQAALRRAGALERAIVVVGRSRRLAVEDHHAELRMLEEEHGAVRADVRKTVGDVGTAFVMAGTNATLLVMQASSIHRED